MNTTGKKNVILGLIRGYDFEVLRPFVETLQKTGYDGDLVFFYADIDEATLAQLKSMGALLVPFKTQFPFFENQSYNKWKNKKPIQNLSIYCLRYLLAYLYLNENGKKYKNVLLADTRDVIFQKDPFDFAMNDICCFMERDGSAIGDSPVNAEWIKNGFGDDVLGRLAHKPIVCSGVTMGTADGIMRYLELFMDIIVARNVPAEMRGMDQGIHNYLIHENLLPVTLYRNSDGPVLTLSLETHVVFKNAKIYNASGGIPNIVHQYDRYWYIAKHFWHYRLRWRARTFLWKRRLIRLYNIITDSAR